MIYLSIKLNQIVSYFKHKVYKFSCQDIFMGTKHLNYVDDMKYLIFSRYKIDDKDMFCKL